MVTDGGPEQFRAVRRFLVQRHAILVLGMHRGGTSALAGALVHLGIDGPRTLIPPDASNELGYWESSPIGQYHDRLLRTLGTSWDAWTPIDHSVRNQTDRARELESLIGQEYGDSTTFVVKDPRISRFVPLWLEVLEGAGVGVKAVVIVRSPREVGMSLAVRDGLAPQLSALLWLRHMLEAEANTRGIPRSIVRYHDLLADSPATIAQVGKDLGVDWPLEAAEVDALLSQHVRPELRHHVLEGSEEDVQPPVSEWLARAVASFDRCVAGHAADEKRVLDEIRSELDLAAALFGAPDERLRDADRQRLLQAQMETRSLAERASALEGHVRALQDHAGALEEQTALGQRRVATLESERDHLEQELSRLESDRIVLMQQLSAVNADRSTLQSRLQALEHDQQQLEVRRRELDAKLAATQWHLDAVLTSRSWQITAPLRLGLKALRRVFSAGAPQTDRADG